jgi:hypothetical protein
MGVWGIACSIQKGQPVVSGWKVTGPRTEAVGEEVFRHTCNPKEDWALQLDGLAAHLETRLRAEPPSVVVVRSLDYSSFGRKEAVSRLHYQVEGVLLAAARNHVDQVHSLTGREIGRVCDLTKAGIDAEAESLFGPTAREQGAAGLAALVLGAEN